MNFLYALMIGLLLFFLGLALAPAIDQTTSEATSTSQLNCTNETSLSNQDMAVCTQMDFFFPVYLGLMLGIAGFVITGIVT